MVVFGQVNIAIGIYGNFSRVIILPVVSTPCTARTPLTDKTAAAGKLLDDIVATARYVKIAASVYGNRRRII